MALINTEIKPFNATAFHNGEFVEVSDADLKGKWSVVFFYPADFTFVCPTELGDLADSYAEFERLGVEIYSVSTDTHFTHKAWHATSDTIGKIQYVMVGDPTTQISQNFDVLREGQGLADRGTFLVDPYLKTLANCLLDQLIGRVFLARQEVADLHSCHPPAPDRARPAGGSVAWYPE